MACIYIYIYIQYTIPDISDATANGLADIQEFHNLDLKKLAKELPQEVLGLQALS